MMTSSLLVRLWDVANTRSQKVVIKVRNVRNTRGNVTAARYSPNGKLIAAGIPKEDIDLSKNRPVILINSFAANMDGSLSIYDTAGPHHRPSHHVDLAHQPSRHMMT